MNREEQLRKIAKEYLKKRFIESRELITKECEMHMEEAFQNYMDAMTSGLLCCAKAGKTVKYIVISILESSNLTKSYELQIAFFTEKMYSDEFPIYVYWKPMFIFSKVEEDMLMFKKKAAEKIVRIKEYELDAIRKEYLLNHYYQVLLFLRQIMPDAIEYGCDHHNCIAQDVTVLLGRYMERAMLVYQLGEMI